MWNRTKEQQEHTQDAKLIMTALQHTEGAIEMVLSVDTWKDPSAWGLFLADLARHVSDAYKQAHGRPADRTLSEVLRIFHAEIEQPTDDARGHLHRQQPEDGNAMGCTPWSD